MVESVSQLPRRRALVALLTGVFAPATACSLFVSLDGLSGGATSQNDDASIDASPSDARAGDADADADASFADAPSGPFCAAQEAGYRVCADFDESSNVVQSFDLASQYGVGGQFSVTTTTFTSPPQSALGVAFAYDAGQFGGDYLVKSVWPLGTTPSITCDFDWQPVAVSTVANDYAHLMEVALWSDDAATQGIVTYSLNLQGDGSVVLLEFGNTTNASHTVTSTITLGTWVHVQIAIDVGSQLYSATIGSANASGVLSTAIPTPSHGTIEVGPVYFGGATTSPSPGWTFVYDNVICR